MQISKVWKNPDFKVWTQPKVDCLLLPMCWKVPAEIPAEIQFLVTSPAYIISHIDCFGDGCAVMILLLSIRNTLW